MIGADTQWALNPVLDLCWVRRRHVSTCPEIMCRHALLPRYAGQKWTKQTCHSSRHFHARPRKQLTAGRKLLHESDRDTALWADSAYTGAAIRTNMKPLAMLANICEMGNTAYPLTRLHDSGSDANTGYNTALKNSGDLFAGYPLVSGCSNLNNTLTIGATGMLSEGVAAYYDGLTTLDVQNAGVVVGSLFLRGAGDSIGSFTNSGGYNGGASVDV